MPRTKTDYSKTIIYRIFCKDDTITDDYIGSTTHFIERKSNHKTACYNVNQETYNFKIYQTIRANGGWENWTMLEIEKFPCQDKNEARTREQYWIDFYKAKLNIKGAIFNIQKKKETRSEYIEKNKDYISKKQSEYYEENKEHIIKKKTEYYEANKEYLIKKQTEYYEANKNKINEKFKCECGGKYTHSHHKSHNQSKRHQLFISNSTI
jgi:hypothetical protein